jgi:uncharacterized protein
MQQTAVITESLRGAGLSFSLDAEGKGLLATVNPEASSRPVDEAWLRARLDELGYGSLRYLAPAATRLLASYNSGKAFSVRLAERADAVSHIVVSPDALQAQLFLEAAQGGAAISIDQVLAALAESGVTWGVDHAAIQAAVAAGAADGVIVARGRAPESGSDGNLESLLPEVRSRTPRIDESGLTDYRDLGAILTVHPGDSLMRRHPATLGVDGLNLRGDTLPAAPGREAMFSANLKGTASAADDPNLLLAAIAGQPVEARGGMVVEPVYTVQDVDTGTGNIDFDGSVVIQGDVAAGMTVHASGDIEIGGTAEAASLEAGGNIVIKGGVLGNPGQSGEYRIRCGGSFSAAFAQKAIIDAGDSIFIDDAAMQCELTANNHVRVGGKKRGHVVGGVARATLSVAAKVLGSDNRTRTRVEIGVNPGMHKVLLDMAKQRDERETALLEVSKLLDFAGKNPGRLPGTKVDQARATAARLAEDIAAMRGEQELLTQKIELSQAAQVVVQATAHEGVEVQMGNRSFRVSGEQGPSTIRLVADCLALVPLHDDGAD